MTSVDIPVQHDPGLSSIASCKVGKKKIVSKDSNLPRPVKPEDIAWRGHGGRQPTLTSVEFDRQLDKIAIWLEDWTHEQRCQIIEGILQQSNYNQFQFLNTSLQPVLHRDFMYTARTQFPAIEFVPISTHTSRRLKEKLIYTRQANYHRIDSAHLRDTEQVKQQIIEKQDKLPDLYTSEGTLLDLGEKKVSGFWSVTPRKRSSRNMYSIDKWISDGPPLYADQPNIRYIDMPMRRHMQDELSPRRSQLCELSSTNLSLSLRHKSNSLLTLSNGDPSAKKIKVKHKNTSQPTLNPSSLPEEIHTVLKWYTTEWTDVKRNEFLHKFLLKLDPRQHYFVSSFLAAKQHKDFVTLLPKDIAVKILSYLSVKELLQCCLVCKSWNALANDNDLWQTKCNTVKMDVPVGQEPEWKKLYKDNMFLRGNWNDGKCRITDLKGHTDTVTCVIFDHERLASGSLDKTIRVWDMKSGKCLHVLKGHLRGVWCLNFFTLYLLISGSFDGTLRVWNLRTGKCTKTIFAHDGAIWALARHNYTIVTVSQDRKAKIWDINRCQHLNSLHGHSAAVFAVDLSEDGRLVITGSADKSVKIWNIETGRCLRWICVSQTSSVMSVSYSHGYLACSYGETICLYKVEGPTKLVKKYQDIVNEHQKRIECLKLQILNKEKGDGILVSAGKDGRVKYWDIQKDKSVQTFIGHRGEPVNAIHFDELRIASAAQDNKIRIWDFNV